MPMTISTPDPIRKSCMFIRDFQSEHGHDHRVSEARPGCEGDEAAMCGWIPHSDKQENTQAGVDAHLHGIASVRILRVQ